MPKFRKKLIVVEAIRYDGSNYQEIAGFVGEKCWVSRRMNAPVLIQTREGRMSAELGDWVVKGADGEFYPVKEYIFLKTYEPVEEGA